MISEILTLKRMRNILKLRTRHMTIQIKKNIFK